MLLVGVGARSRGQLDLRRKKWEIAHRITTKSIRIGLIWNIVDEWTAVNGTEMSAELLP
jgi:hypothetical protein